MKYFVIAEVLSLGESPPARGAWIEIRPDVRRVEKRASPPARGAWIEITWCPTARRVGDCRPPHGGRGLKYLQTAERLAYYGSPPARGAWIEMISAGA